MSASAQRLNSWQNTAGDAVVRPYSTRYEERERQSGPQIARLEIARDFGRATDQRLAHVRAELRRALAEQRERRKRVRPDEPAQRIVPDA